MRKREIIIEEIKEALELEKYSEAALLWNELVSDDVEYDVVLSILDASIGAGLGNRDRMWEAIKRGMGIDAKNVELFILLGNYYLEENLNQAYLCYENALFYSKDTQEQEYINEMLLWLQENGALIRPVSFVILSYNAEKYTKLCINSIRATVPFWAREIVVVDNGSKDGSVEWLKEQPDIVLVENDENVGFPKGCNQGISVASEDADIMLLNNDTILPANALFWLRMGLYSNEENGTAGSVSNYVGNLQQVAEGIKGVDNLLLYGEKNNIPMKYPYENKLFLIGFAVIIRREVLDKIGGLDERFSPGNSEDEDYGLQVLRAGYNNVLCKNSFIFHFGSVSFKKDMSKYMELLHNNRRKINEKWGIDTNYYLYPKQELIGLIDEFSEKEIKVLDIGCGCGAMLGRIKGLFPNAVLYGVETEVKAAEIGSHIGNVVCGDIEELDMPWPEEFFDYVFMDDVLGRLHNPGVVLKKLHKYLKKDGRIIVSMLNVKHFSVMIPLLKKDTFSCLSAGRTENTHLTMYTGTETIKLLTGSGYDIEYWGYTTFGQPNESEERLLDLLVSLMDEKDKSSYLAYRYIAKAKNAMEIVE